MYNCYSQLSGFTRVSAYLDWIHTNMRQQKSPYEGSWSKNVATLFGFASQTTIERVSFSRELSSYAFALNRLGRIVETIEQADASLALDPSNVDAMFVKSKAQGELFAKRNAWTKALESFSLAFNYSSNNAVKSDMLVKQSAILSLQGRNEEAFRTAEEAFKLQPQNTQTLSQMRLAKKAMMRFGEGPVIG
jgi:tetratricopeptide (TPR) repeat protein